MEQQFEENDYAKKYRKMYVDGLLENNPDTQISALLAIRNLHAVEAIPNIQLILDSNMSDPHIKILATKVMEYLKTLNDSEKSDKQVL